MIKYRKDIDGLRSLAIIPVVLYHAGFWGATGGFVGVDVFFVISGYLITRIISGELAAGSFSIIGFYERRVRRIMPALIVLLGGCLMIGSIVLLPDDLAGLAWSSIATLFFISNVYFWRVTGDYFSDDAEFFPLLNTWSLGVEEQFYIFFPLMLMFLFRYAPRHIKTVVLVTVIGSLAVALIAVHVAPRSTFFLLHTRAWELGVGSLLALTSVAPMRSAARRNALGALGLVLIIAPVLLYDENTTFPGAAAIPPVLGAALLILVGGAGGSLATSLISARALVFTGLLSYSLYLWHWPILSFARHLSGSVDLDPSVAALCVALSLVAAYASWRWVERPFRKPDGFSRNAMFGGAGSVALLTTALCAALILADGAPGRLPTRALAAIDAAHDVNPLRKACFEPDPAGPFCRFGADSDSAPSFFLWGDSHAEAVMPGFDQAARETGVVGLAAMRAACAPILGVSRADRRDAECGRMNDAVADAIASDPSIRVVFLMARWPLLAEGTRARGEGGAAPVLVDARSERGDAQTNAAILERGLERTVRRLSDAGKRVVLVGATPEAGFNVPRVVARAIIWGTPSPVLDFAGDVAPRHRRANRILESVASGAPRVEVMPLIDLFCASDCFVERDGAPMFRDDDHMTASGARMLLAGRIADVLRRNLTADASED